MIDDLQDATRRIGGMVADGWSYLAGWVADQTAGIRALNELEVTLIVSIILSAVFTSIAIVKVLTAMVLRYQRSRTQVGARFRSQKHAEFYLFLALGVTFGIQAFLLGSLPEMPIGRAIRHAIQFTVVASAVWALIRGIGLVLALMQQNWGRPSLPGRRVTRQDTTRTPH